MAESLIIETDVRRVWAGDRRKAVLAVRLMTCCLGVQAQPGFALVPTDDGDAERRPRNLGECLYKDAFYFRSPEGAEEVQVLVVDEKGNVLAESADMASLSRALELLDRLPLRLSPHAEGWLRDALGERDDWL